MGLGVREGICEGDSRRSWVSGEEFAIETLDGVGCWGRNFRERLKMGLGVREGICEKL
jgi:hypothetical protein